MGYYTTVEGEITITPPLTWSEIKDSPFNTKSTAFDDRMDAHLDITEEIIDTDEGQLIRRTATGIKPASTEEYKAYYLIEHVQKLMDSHPGHTFAGHFDCSGEESGDVWRLVIRNGHAEKIEAQLTWGSGPVDRLALRDVLAEGLNRARLATEGQVGINTEHDRLFLATALAGVAAEFIEGNQ
jgi:hypothetical protein